MARKSKTKLLKLVCKRAEMMRQPFRNSSWSNKMNQSDNKPLVLKKPGENFWSKITNLSVGKTRSAIQKEWIILKQTQESNRREQCLCGRPNLKYITYLKNIINKREITSGNCCLEAFKG